MLNRRSFITKTSTLSAAGLLFSAELFAKSPLLEKIGIQFFSLPKLLEKDFPGTLAMLSQMGYKEVELYGPYPFSAASAQQRWDAVTPSLGFKGSGYFGHTVDEVKNMLKKQ
jgi:hypothetical protein